MPPPAAIDDEQSRLDAAMQRADDLLVTSLKRDERTRRQTKLRWLALVAGGLAMLATLGLVSLLLLQSNGKPAAPPAQSADANAVVSAADEAEAEKLSQEAWQLWQSRKLAPAEDKFTQAVKLDPNLTAAWNGLGWTKFNTGQFDAAETSFQHVIALEPKHPAALNGLGQLYLARNEFDKAEKYLLDASPTAPAAWWGLTKMYLLQGKWPEAERYAQKIIDSGQATGAELDDVNAMLKAAQDKSLPPALRKQIAPATVAGAAAGKSGGSDAQQGWAAFNRGNSVKARQLFEMALQKDPKDAVALNGLGWVMLTTGDAEGARPQFEAALKIDPEAAGAMNGLARVYRQQGRLDDAIKLWEDMTTKFPGVNAGTFGLADAYIARGQPDKAIPLYEQIVKANPNDQESKTKLEEARKQAGL
jgi:tetratricopeptide (TPR) repeat protein